MIIHFGSGLLNKNCCGKLPLHQAGNLRGQSPNPGGSRQPLTSGCQKKQQKYSQPYSAPLMIDFARHTLNKLLEI